ncbi:MAG: sigma 54-interacting transcriptional regulator [Bdellovibrionota bacterium]|nr:sigma 54-interacting transcriptional regulator [Bdellovibrionota bacterium]
MKDQLNKNYFSLENLESFLFSTLDEKVFFEKLSSFLIQEIKVDRVLSYYLQDGGETLKLIAAAGKKGREPKPTLVNQGAGACVIRTKKPYFSNNVSRDPVFCSELKEGLASELCVPVLHEGVVMATLHFQNFSKGFSFDEECLSSVNEIIRKISKPLSNMKMYLTAKLLNESLLKKIEIQEKKIQDKDSSQVSNPLFKAEDKKIIANSDKMLKVLSLAEKLSYTDINFLIKGEKGTGKESVAKRVHCKSSRKEKPFVTVDCSSLSSLDLNNRLFGLDKPKGEKGNSFQKGLLEIADGGTLLLKNVERLDEDIQCKLSHFLKEKMAYRINGRSPFSSNVRVIATTNIDLDQEVFSKQTFKEDLFYKLNTFTLEVPSLKERKEDLPSLVGHFLSTKEFMVNGEEKSLSPRAMSKLAQHIWPGNVSELQSVLKKSILMTQSGIIEISHLPELATMDIDLEDKDKEEEVFVEMTLGDLEKKHICRTLSFLGGNKTKTAKTLGITVKTLYNKLHSYGMITYNF